MKTEKRKQWLLDYRIRYTDGVSSNYEEVFEASTEDEAKKYAEQFLQKENEPLDGVSSVRLINLREYRD